MCSSDLTTGVNANYKTYDKAYYTLDASGNSIVYHKPTAGTTYATIKGIKSGVDINSASAISDGTVGGKVTLTAAMLGTTGVTVTVPKTNSSAKFELALASGVPTAEQKDVTEWVTTGTNAVYKTYDKGYYTYDSAKNAITYTTGTNAKGTEYATIKGASGDVTATLGSGANSNNFMLVGSELSNKITIGSKVMTDKETQYGFHFNNTYNNSAITASANNDTITALGDKLTITGGKGDDNITLGTGDRAGNTIIYSNGDGEDVIANFQAGDSITVKSLTPEVDFSGNDVEITFGSKAGKITLSDCSLKSITINGKSYDDDSASNVLLADNNYSMDAAQLSSIVNADLKSYTPYDFSSNFSLTKEESFVPEITYAKDK